MSHKRKHNKDVFYVAVTIFLLFLFGGVVVGSLQEETPAKHVVLVLDNSASMKAHDPQGLIKSIVKKFVEELLPSDSLSIIIYDSQISIPLQLSQVAQLKETDIQNTLNSLNYQGKFTFSASAMERALRELKKESNEKENRIIVFLTDGVIDTGNQAKDKEKRDWLFGSITTELSEQKIRVFGLALGDKADFEMLQRVSSRTGGDYFAITSLDQLKDVFENLNGKLKENQVAKEQVEPEAGTANQEVEETGMSADSNMIYLIVAVAIALIFLILIIVLNTGKAKNQPTEKAQSRPKEGPLNIPLARLTLPESITNLNKDFIDIQKAEFWAGSDPAQCDLFLHGDLISSNHFKIIFDQSSRAFKLFDNSTNGTWLIRASSTPERVEEGKPFVLKDGDKIMLPGYGNEMALKFSLLASKKTRMMVGSAELRSQEFEMPLMTVTYVGADKSAFLPVPMTSVAESKFYIEQLIDSSAELSYKYRINSLSDDVLLNGSSFVKNEKAVLKNGDRISFVGNTKSELVFTDTENRGSQGSASDGSATDDGGEGSENNSEQGNQTGKSDLSPDPESSFSSVDLGNYKSTNVKKTKIYGARTVCAVHADQQAVFICASCGKVFCEQCRKSFEERDYCQECYREVKH